ncbi:YitT family protein [Pelosinus sp. sgz500959]|uniref:YitT family protein n=1 Tax=Pelosinus sp. sgz500959 TaxID=3242472 RepID=UPI00366B3E31
MDIMKFLHIGKNVDLIKLAKVLSGCMIVSIGIIILKHAQLMTGGTAGLAFSLMYYWGIPFSIGFFIINIPFYILALMRMGLNFTISTIFAVMSLSCMTELNRWAPDFVISALLGAILGGITIGLGVAYLFFHGSSLGGANILVLYLQKRFGWDPGKMTFIIDFLVVMSGVLSVGVIKALYSLLSIGILSWIISLFKAKIASRHMLTPSSSLEV